MTGSDPLSCDVLVIGGGLAAAAAAISAAEAGASVVMVIKGAYAESGSSAKAAGIIAAAFGHGGADQRPVSDSPHEHAADSLAVGHGLGDPRLVQVLAEDAPDAVSWLERMGVGFSKAEDGGFLQLQAPGNRCPRACSALGGGAAIMSALGGRLDALGVHRLERAAATRLLRHGGRAVGAELRHRNDRRVSRVQAASVVLAAGGATGLFPTLSGDQANVGNGLMLGFEAGAELANLEFIEFTLIYRVRGQVLRIAGLAPFMSRGGRLVDRHGDDILARQFPGAEPARLGRADLLRAVCLETASGTGPIAIDCRHFSADVWDEFQRAQGTAVLDRIREAGGDPVRERIEVVPAAHSILAGLVINAKAATGVPGLYAAGENATGIHGAGRLSGNGLAACLVFGRRAGAAAASFARETPKLQSLKEAAWESGRVMPEEEVSDMRRRLEKLAGEGLGVVRDGGSLMSVRDGFRHIRDEVSCISDMSPDVLDLRHMAALGEMMAEAALKRTESRGVQFRTDCMAPEVVSPGAPSGEKSSQTAWRKWLTVRRDPDTGEAVWGERMIAPAD